MTVRILCLVVAFQAIPVATYAQAIINPAKVKPKNRAAAIAPTQQLGGKRNLVNFRQGPAATKQYAKNIPAFKSRKKDRGRLADRNRGSRSQSESTSIDRELLAAKAANLRHGSRRHGDKQRLAQLRTDFLLSRDEFDRDNGKIYWPRLLRERRYGTFRKQLDQLFRAGPDGQLDFDEVQIRVEVERLLDELEEHRSELSAEDYLAAKRFLHGLEYEPVFFADGE